MVMARNEMREDLFAHGESAFLCDPGDTQAFTDNIDILQNDIQIRKALVQNARQIIDKKFHGNKSQYREAYRTSIEQAFFVGTSDEAE
jgi:glycosyltransferase involved in cell wall biosynthesis